MLLLWDMIQPGRNKIKNLSEISAVPLKETKCHLSLGVVKFAYYLQSNKLIALLLFNVAVFFFLKSLKLGRTSLPHFHPVLYLVL